MGNFTVLQFLLRFAVAKIKISSQLRSIFSNLPIALQYLLSAAWSYINANLQKKIKAYELVLDFNYDPYEDFAFFQFIVYTKEINEETLQLWEQLTRRLDNYIESLGSIGKHFSKLIYIIFLPRD